MVWIRTRSCIILGFFISRGKQCLFSFPIVLCGGLEEGFVEREVLSFVIYLGPVRVAVMCLFGRSVVVSVNIFMRDGCCFGACVMARKPSIGVLLLWCCFIFFGVIIFTALSYL